MKVAELEGEHLDYWVARAEGMVVTDPKELAELAAMGVEGPQVYWIAHNGEIGGTEPLGNRYTGIHSSWMRAGPIIERESIALLRPDQSEWQAGPSATAEDTWHGWIAGPTPLIAAMRAFVASKYGETVPDEVLA